MDIIEPDVRESGEQDLEEESGKRQQPTNGDRVAEVSELYWPGEPDPETQMAYAIVMENMGQAGQVESEEVRRARVRRRTKLEMFGGILEFCFELLLLFLRR